MTILLLTNVVISMTLAATMLLAGISWGRRQALASLAKLVDEGRFKLQAADGRSATSAELMHLLGALAAGPRSLFKPVVAGAIVAACVACALAFVVVSSVAH